MMRKRGIVLSSAFVGLAAALFAVAPAHAQYTSDFENLNASAGGTILTGQDNFYLPSGVDFNAYIYAGNTLGVVQNPAGGKQFVAGRGPGDGTNYARAQRDITWGTGFVEVQYDVAGLFLGSSVTVDNVGSFSVQPYPGSQDYIHLFSWVDPSNPTAFKGWYMSYDVNGVIHNAPGISPGPAWDNLDVNHWYRFGTVLDFATNRIVYAWITDLHTGTSDGVTLTDWYMEGGAAGKPAPTGFRFFAGGGNGSDNVTAWDNMSSETVGLLATLEGDCPGRVKLNIAGATPNGKVAIVAGLKPGQFTNPNPPCQGITLDLKPPFLPGFPKIVKVDGNGNLSVGGQLSANLCGKLLVQVVDLTTCEVSNIVKK